MGDAGLARSKTPAKSNQHRRAKSARKPVRKVRKNARRSQPSPRAKARSAEERSLESPDAAGEVAGVSAGHDESPVATHVAKANDYIRKVLAGEIPACKFVKAACQRQLDDLAKQSDPTYPWIFDEERAERVCHFIELCPHIKGPLQNQLIRLEPWQCFSLATVFGWVSKQTGARRFREAYTEVPGGNGKTALSAPLFLYMLAADGEGGAEVFAAATTREQAKLVFWTAQEMARRMPEFRDLFGVEVLAHSIYQGSSASRGTPMTSEAGTSEGINVHCAIIDELHKHSTRGMYDVIKNHMGKRTQPLVWIITTAGSDRAGVCYEVRDYVIKILEGVCSDDRVFGIVYTLDEEDDWTLEASWIKANPNWGISVFPDAIAAEAHQALQIASKQPAFKTKHLDIWVSADHAWMDMQRWAKCADLNLKETDFVGLLCVLGLDLAGKLDLLAKMKLFWKDIPISVAIGSTDHGPCENRNCKMIGPQFRATDGTREWKVCELHRDEIIKGGKKKRHYYVFGDYWTPEKRLEETQNSQYRGWAIEERLNICPGETNNYDLVEDSIRDDCRKFTVLEVAHDPYQAQQFVNHLQPEGITMVEVPQQTKYLSEPMKELEAAVYDGSFHFNGDPILTWAVSNVVCHEDANGNLFPRKPHKKSKIDPATALLTGLNRAMAAPENFDPASGTPFFV